MPDRLRAPRLPVEVRREQTLDALQDSLAEVGLSELTIEEIARRAGFGRPRVYHSVGDLDDALLMLVRRSEARVLERLGEIVLPTWTETARDLNGAERTLAAVFEDVRSAREEWRALLLPIAEAPPKTRARLVSNRATVAAELAELGRASMSASSSVATVDWEVLSYLAIAVFEEFARDMISRRRRMTPRRLARALTAVIAPMLERMRTGR